MFLIFPSFYLTYCSFLFIFVIPSSCFDCFLVSFVISFFSFVVFNLSLALSFHPLASCFPFTSIFSFFRPLFHFCFLYFVIALSSYIHSLIRSFFSLCLFPFVFFHVFPLCISFLFLFFWPCPLPCLVPSSRTLFPTS